MCVRVREWRRAGNDATASSSVVSLPGAMGMGATSSAQWEWDGCGECHRKSNSSIGSNASTITTTSSNKSTGGVEEGPWLNDKWNVQWNGEWGADPREPPHCPIPSHIPTRTPTTTQFPTEYPSSSPTDKRALAPTPSVGGGAIEPGEVEDTIDMQQQNQKQFSEPEEYATEKEDWYYFPLMLLGAMMCFGAVSQSVRHLVSPTGSQSVSQSVGQCGG
jgi:hypothetical protein